MDAEYLFQGKRSPQSVINRSYYAMFYSVLALLQKIGKVSPKHTGVISLFDTEFVLNNIIKERMSTFARTFPTNMISFCKVGQCYGRYKENLLVFVSIRRFSYIFRLAVLPFEYTLYKNNLATYEQTGFSLQVVISWRLLRRCLFSVYSPVEKRSDLEKENS